MSSGHLLISSSAYGWVHREENKAAAFTLSPLQPVSQFYLMDSQPSRGSSDQGHLPMTIINQRISVLIVLESYLLSDTSDNSLLKTLSSLYFPPWSPFLSLIILLCLFVDSTPSLTLCTCGCFPGLAFSSLLVLCPLLGRAQLRPTSSDGSYFTLQEFQMEIPS